jgi:hypothetical protein
MKIKHADVARIASEVRHTQTHPCNAYTHIEGIFIPLQVTSRNLQRETWIDLTCWILSCS